MFSLLFLTFSYVIHLLRLNFFSFDIRQFVTYILSITLNKNNDSCSSDSLFISSNNKSSNIFSLPSNDRSSSTSTYFISLPLDFSLLTPSEYNNYYSEPFYLNSYSKNKKSLGNKDIYSSSNSSSLINSEIYMNPYLSPFNLNEFNDKKHSSLLENDCIIINKNDVFYSSQSYSLEEYNWKYSFFLMVKKWSKRRKEFLRAQKRYQNKKKNRIEDWIKRKNKKWLDNDSNNIPCKDYVETMDLVIRFSTCSVCFFF